MLCRETVFWWVGPASVRRHHCRMCGSVVCAACMPVEQTRPLERYATKDGARNAPAGAPAARQRVCNSCVDKLDELAAWAERGSYLALTIVTPSASPPVQWPMRWGGEREGDRFLGSRFPDPTFGFLTYDSRTCTPLQAARLGLTPAQWGLERYGAAGGTTPLQAAQRRLAFAASQLARASSASISSSSSVRMSDDIDVVDLIGKALAALTPFPVEQIERMEREARLSSIPFDIGVFGSHALSPGTEFLMGTRPAATLAEAQTLASELGGRADATLRSYPDRVLIGANSRHQLKSMLDREHSLRVACGKHVHDLQLTLTRDELLQMISKSELVDIEALYCAASAAGHSFNQIKLRRVGAKPGECIQFHTDVSSTLTMQVPLNDDSEYDGGRLMFATASGMLQPARPAGSATIHESHVVHGVSQMLGGVRYGLFLLRSTAGWEGQIVDGA